MFLEPNRNETDVSNLSEMVYCGPTHYTPPPRVDDDRMRQLKLYDVPLTPVPENDPTPNMNNNNGTMQRSNGALCTQEAINSSNDLAELHGEKPASGSMPHIGRGVKQKVPPAVPPRGPKKHNAHKSSESIEQSSEFPLLKSENDQENNKIDQDSREINSSESTRQLLKTPLLCEPNKIDEIPS
jgi:hypothetical protein